ncbi:MAG: hypothetical protein GYB67_17940 [Chloroflexi bacterium]|nr:hypothetical protein [Chloroflexota bacterium]
MTDTSQTKPEAEAAAIAAAESEAAAETAPAVEPIDPAQARAILDAAMDDLLGDDWQAEDSGWQLVTGHDYMARVTKGGINVDFYVDLLGEVTIEKRHLNPAQTSGRLLAWIILLLALGIAFLMARAVGWL